MIGSPQGETDDPTGETETSPTDPSDPSDPSGPDPTQGDCVSDDDCSYGYSCINSFCQYNCYCGCGVLPPPPGSQLRCSEGPGYECYSDAECGEGEICGEYHWCEPAPDECAGIPIEATTIELFFNAKGGAPVRDLQFADVSPEPGVELLVARDVTIERVVGEDSGEIVVHTQGELVAFAAGDLGGDAALDIVTAEDDGSLRFWWAQDGALVEAAIIEPVPDVRALFILDRDGDGARDVYAHSGRDLFVFPTIDGLPLGDGVRLLEERVDAIALFDAKDDGEIEALFADGASLSVFRDFQDPPYEPFFESKGGVFGPVVVGDFDGNGEPDGVGFGTSEQVTFVGEIATWGPLVERASTPTAAATGDIDGDGRADLVLLDGAGAITIRFGAHAGIPKSLVVPFGCEMHYAIDSIGEHIAVGDHDGDGRAELAISDGSRVILARF